jgi:drug/metabolite transporter (DMT)-like permease
MKASLWLVAPSYAAWREGKFNISRPVEPFRRWNPKAMRWEVPLIVPGAIAVGLALKFGVPGLAILGVAWAFIGGFRLAARLVVPRRWVETETDFVAMTTGGIAIRIALGVGLISSLALAEWTLALAFGIALALLALSGIVASAVLRRIVRRAKSAGA